VEIEVPRPYEKLLVQGLDLVRWQGSERVTLPLLERLVAESRKKAAEALAAEGYFSADIKAPIETPSADEAIVRMLRGGERDSPFRVHFPIGYMFQ
jgi:hypothetical protein